MQLHNLVLISIQKSNLDFNSDSNHQIYSPTKNKYLKSNLKDQILWKKSNSAFKKFKGKKDRQNKSSQSSQCKIQFLENKTNILPSQKKFYLVNIEAKHNSSAMHNQQTFKVELEYQYYDPNIAPFFKYNSQDPHNVQVNEPISLELKRQQSTNQKNPSCNKNSKSIVQKQIQKQKQKININLQVYQKDIIVNKYQNNKYNKSNLLNQQYPIHKNISQTEKDPFIIIKSACLKKSDQLKENLLKKQQSIRQENKKTKHIKKLAKNSYVKVGSCGYSTSYVPYLNNKSNYQKNQSSYSVQNENLMNQDDLQINLPFIQFDLCMHIPSQISHNMDDQNICIRDQEAEIKNINQSIQTNLTQLSQDSKFNNIKQSQMNNIREFQQLK